MESEWWCQMGVKWMIDENWWKLSDGNWVMKKNHPNSLLVSGEILPSPPFIYLFWGMVPNNRQAAISSYHFFIFDGTILTLCNINITCDYIFVTFRGSLIFFSHLIVLSLYCAVPTSHVTVLLSHLMVPLFFFFTFYGTILTFSSTNITCNCTFVTFSSSPIFFSHLMVLSSHCAAPTSHVTALLSYSLIVLFSLTFNGTIFTLSSTTILHFRIIKNFQSLLSVSESLTFFFSLSVFL